MNFPYGYQGQEKDAATGLTNFELRQYDPRISRWYNPDPYGQHHSPYLAMSNNPVSFTDPDGGWDYEIDGAPVSKSVYNSMVGYSGNVGSVSYGGLSYGTVLGYSYNGEDFYGSQSYKNALAAQLSHWGQLGIMSDGQGNFYQKYNFGLIGNYGTMKGGAGLEDMTDLANAVLAKNRAEKLNDYYGGSAKFAWEHGNYADWAEYKLKGALGEDYDKKVEKAGQPYAQAIADLNPLMNASHIINGLATGQNGYGDKMTGSGYAWAAVGMIPLGAEAKGATGGSSTIYRAVSQAEADDIAKFGFRTTAGGYEFGKLFAPTLGEAARYGRLNYMRDGIPNVIMKVKVPNNILNNAYRFSADGMNALSIDAEFLHLLQGTPMKFSPLIR